MEGVSHVELVPHRRARGLTAEVITYPGGGGDEIHAYVRASPLRTSRCPGSWPCTTCRAGTSSTGSSRERLARHGYRVICPDLYCRFGHGTPDDMAAQVRAQGGVADDSVVADCAAAMEWLKALPGEQRQSRHHRHLLRRPPRAAGRLPGHRASTRSSTCGAVEWSRPKRNCRPPARSRRSTTPQSCPRRCSGCSATTTASLARAGEPARGRAEAARQDYEFHRYDGAGHGFFYYHTPMYRPEAAMDGWAKVFSFFGGHLSG